MEITTLCVIVLLTIKTDNYERLNEMDMANIVYCPCSIIVCEQHWKDTNSPCAWYHCPESYHRRN